MLDVDEVAIDLCSLWSLIVDPWLLHHPPRLMSPKHAHAPVGGQADTTNGRSDYR